MNCAKSRPIAPKVYDVMAGKEIGYVLEVNTRAGWVKVLEMPFWATKHGRLATRRIRFASIYAIKGGEDRPVLFHCYWRKT